MTTIFTPGGEASREIIGDRMAEEVEHLKRERTRVVEAPEGVTHLRFRIRQWSTPPTTADWNALRSAISGEVVLPESGGYDSARKPAIARFHEVRPRAIVLCENPEDVSTTISFARRTGLRTATRSGGHCFAGRSSTEGIVIDVSPMRSVSVSDAVATVGAGARLGEVYDALDEHGLTFPAGCGPDVGISGLTLGGGSVSSAASTG